VPPFRWGRPSLPLMPTTVNGENHRPPNIIAYATGVETARLALALAAPFQRVGDAVAQGICCDASITTASRYSPK
jgi:hypothetical protein